MYVSDITHNVRVLALLPSQNLINNTKFYNYEELIKKYERQ
jgi:hypothetical protein